MKTKNRVISLFLAILMLVMAIPPTIVSAASAPSVSITVNDTSLELGQKTSYTATAKGNGYLLNTVTLGISYYVDEDDYDAGNATNYVYQRNTGLSVSSKTLNGTFKTSSGSYVTGTENDGTGSRKLYTDNIGIYTITITAYSSDYGTYVKKTKKIVVEEPEPEEPEADIEVYPSEIELGDSFEYEGTAYGNDYTLNTVTVGFTYYSSEYNYSQKIATDTGYLRYTGLSTDEYDVYKKIQTGSNSYLTCTDETGKTTKQFYWGYVGIYTITLYAGSNEYYDEYGTNIKTTKRIDVIEPQKTQIPKAEIDVYPSEIELGESFEYEGTAYGNDYTLNTVTVGFTYYSSEYNYSQKIATDTGYLRYTGLSTDEYDVYKKIQTGSNSYLTCTDETGKTTKQFYWGYVGIYTITLYAGSSEYYEEYDENVKTTVRIDVISPVSQTVGDINNDGDITNKDRFLLNRYLAGMAGYTDIDKKIADINGDDSVNAADAEYLARHLAGWVGYEKLQELNTDTDAGADGENIPNTCEHTTYEDRWVDTIFVNNTIKTGDKHTYYEVYNRVCLNKDCGNTIAKVQTELRSKEHSYDFDGLCLCGAYENIGFEPWVGVNISGTVVNVYGTPNATSRYGYINKNEIVTVLGKYDNKYLIEYKLDSGNGVKQGYVFADNIAYNIDMEVYKYYPYDINVVECDDDDTLLFSITPVSEHSSCLGVYPVLIPYDINIHGRQNIDFGIADKTLGTFILSDASDAIWFVRVEKSEISSALNSIKGEDSIWYKIDGEKIYYGLEGWGELIFKKTLDGLVGGDQITWVKHEDFQANAEDVTMDIAMFLFDVVNVGGKIAHVTIKEAAKIVISHMVKEITKDQLMKYIKATGLEIFFGKNVDEEQIMSMMQTDEEYAKLMEAYLEYGEPRGIGLLTFTREVVEMIKYAKEKGVSQCIINQKGLVVVLENGAFSKCYELVQFNSQVDISNIKSNTAELINQHIVDKSAPSDTSNTDNIGFAPLGYYSYVSIESFLDVINESLIVTVSDVEIKFPNELIKVNSGVGSDGKIWTKYYFTYKYGLKDETMYMMHVRSHENSEGYIYIMFAKAGDSGLIGNHDEIYRKAEIKTSVGGEKYFYLSSGSTIAIGVNAKLSNGALCWHPLESVADNFLYWNASENNILTTDEWRNKIHYEERALANSDSTLPESAAAAVVEGFIKLPEGDSKYHQLDSSKKEFELGSCLKYAHPDGREAIYEVVLNNQNKASVESNSQATQLLTLNEYPLIGPTFNYAPNDFSESWWEGLLLKLTHNSIAHYYFDMLPYYWWNNVPNQ